MMNKKKIKHLNYRRFVYLKKYPISYRRLFSARTPLFINVYFKQLIDAISTEKPDLPHTQ